LAELATGASAAIAPPTPAAVSSPRRPTPSLACPMLSPQTPSGPGRIAALMDEVRNGIA
jgi:hypothetical protein